MPSKWRNIGALTDSKWERLPRIPAVYVVYSWDRIVYIGSTVDLRGRIHSYQFGYAGVGWRKLNRLRVKYRESTYYGDWLMIEARLIRRLQPRCNVRNKNGVPKPLAYSRGAREVQREW
jgi:excinuclease UvrABC nuclease subunit